MAVYKALNATTYVFSQTLTVNEDYTNPNRSFAPMLRSAQFESGSDVYSVVYMDRFYGKSSTVTDFGMYVAPSSMSTSEKTYTGMGVTLADGTIVYGINTTDTSQAGITFASDKITKMPSGELTAVVAHSGGVIEAITTKIDGGELASSGAFIYIYVPLNKSDALLSIKFTT